ncbi:MAG: hypothetical protein M0C28_45645 [Candidatus Moduliflexus flocculans]|nr:hypothetical protein [Candidatus Moduliflexus flocculans]
MRTPERTAVLKRSGARSLERRRLRTGAIAALGVVLLLGGLFFSLRNVILRGVLDSRIRSYEATHAGDILRVGTARFSGSGGHRPGKHPGARARQGPRRDREKMLRRDRLPQDAPRPRAAEAPGAQRRDPRPEPRRPSRPASDRLERFKA